MTCNVRDNTINSLKNKGLINDSMVIQNLPVFNSYNDRYTKLAKEKYGIENENLLFSIQKITVSKATPHPYYREDKVTIYKAIVNTALFDKLQERFNFMNGELDNNKITSQTIFPNINLECK